MECTYSYRPKMSQVMLFKVISVSPLFFAYTPLLTFMYSTLPGYILQKLNIKTFFFLCKCKCKKKTGPHDTKL